MNTENEVWYVMEDGTACAPSDVLADDAGALRNKDGVAVAMKGEFHHTTGNPARYNGEKEMSPEKPKRSYKTRESKAD